MVWELGGGYGHYARLLPLARLLQSTGHDVVLALRDLTRVHSLVPNSALTLIQAPMWPMPLESRRPPYSYAEILLHFGFADAEALQGPVDAWRRLFMLIQPALIVFDHAPTALLAARGFPARKMTLSGGFETPPATQPMPAMRWWEQPQPERLLRSEMQALATCNTVLNRHGQPPLSALMDLLDVDVRVLCTLAELDHYPTRGSDAHYWGPMTLWDARGVPCWPADGTRVFAYIDPAYPGFDKLVAALQVSTYSTVLHAPGLRRVSCESMAGPNLVIASQPVSLYHARAQAEIFICHGPGTAMAGLLGGVVPLMLPRHVEQFMVSMRLLTSGLTKHVIFDPDQADFRAILGDTLNDQGLRSRVSAFAARYPYVRPEATLQAVAQRGNALLA